MIHRNLVLFSMIALGFSFSLVYADVEFEQVGIFCPLTQEPAFTEIVEFLEICPINSGNTDDLILESIVPIQTIFNPPQLVEGKRTLFEVKITNNFATPIITDVSVFYDDSQGQPIVQIKQLTLPIGTSSHILPDDPDFAIPFLDPFDYRAEVAVVPGEINTQNNIGANQSASIKDTKSFAVLYIPVTLKSDPIDPPSVTEIEPYASASSDYIIGAFPIALDEHSYSITPFVLESKGAPPLGIATDAVMRQLLTFLEHFKWDSGDFHRVVGVVRDNFYNDNLSSPIPHLDWTGNEGAAGVDAKGFKSAIVEIDNNLGVVNAHEIYHTFENPGHVTSTSTGFWVDNRCKMGYWDVLTSSCDPLLTAVNLMRGNVCDIRDPLNCEVDEFIRSWPNDDEYLNLLNQEEIDPAVIGISGVVYTNGTVLTEPWKRFDSTLDAIIDDTGEITVQYIDSNNVTIAQTGFDLMRNFTGGQYSTEFGGFALKIPDIANSEKIILKNDTQTLFERVISPNSPSVSILSPNGGETFFEGDTLNLSWNSSDADNDELSYSVLFSFNSGQTWIPFTIFYLDETLDVKVTNQMLFDNVLVKVIVSDGINTAEDTSDSTFSIKPIGDKPLALYVASHVTDEILRYNETSGNFIDAFVTSGSGGLDEPQGLAFNSNENLLVSSGGTNEIIEYDGDTGIAIGTFANSLLNDPRGLTIGSDGLLYVANNIDDNIVILNGTTGAFVGTIDIGLNNPTDVVFGLDGLLYATNNIGDSVSRYNSTGLTFVDTFVTSGSGGLNAPHGLTFGTDGNLYVSSAQGNNNVITRYNGTTGAFMDIYASGGPIDDPKGMLFGPDGNLYVSNEDDDNVVILQGPFGNSPGVLVAEIVTSGSGGLNGPWNIILGPFSAPPPAGNTPPVAIDDSDSTPQDTQFTIDVLANDTDADLDPLTVDSVNTTGTQGTVLNNGNDVTYTPPPSFTGVDTFTYIATDGTDTSNSATVTVTVTASGNNPPVANAGIDQTITEGTLVQLDGTASFDPDSDPLTYSWTKVSGPKANLDDPTSPTPTFTAPNVGPSGKTIVFQLIVNDGTVNSAPDTVTIEVTNN